ncbi:hypothetical protein [Micromonospora coerulea]|uniref:hypothetical protein n=1 Tax=Micromonospora coerulea TaxID=47856 RepID=UPI0031F7B1C9
MSGRSGPPAGGSSTRDCSTPTPPACWRPVIVHALCDLVRVHTTAAGTTVRLHMLREVPR